MWKTKGCSARSCQGKRDAALWRAYKKEFGGVNQGSGEAFMEVSAREFRKVYDEESANRH